MIGTMMLFIIFSVEIIEFFSTTITKQDKFEFQFSSVQSAERNLKIQLELR